MKNAEQCNFQISTRTYQEKDRAIRVCGKTIF